MIDQEAKARQQSLARFITRLDDRRTAEDLEHGLAAYLRLWVLRHVMRGQPK